MAIRPARPGELASAIEVWRAANTANALPRHQQRLSQWAQQPETTLFVAADDEASRLVGMILTLAGRADDGAGDPIPGLRHLTGLAVRPDHQQRGIGSQLLRTALDHARRHNCERVTLAASATNQHAHRLFEAHGFHRTDHHITDETGATMFHFEHY